MDEDKPCMSDEEVREFIRKHMPSLRELAPTEYEAMVKNGELLAEKLTAYMQGAMRGREKSEAFAFAVLVGEKAVIEVGAVVVGIVAGEIAASKSGIQGPGES